jgi:nuclear pore complex protein Nup155
MVGAGAVWDSWPSLKIGSSASSNTEHTILQVLVDKERELLYLRRRNTSIELWNLQKGQSVKVASVKDVKRLAGTLCPGSPLVNGNNGPFEIIKMEIISSKEGRGIGLVCVTNAGLRLYFTHLRGGIRGYGEPPSPSTPPAVLELVHVRLPAPYPPPDKNRIRHSHISSSGSSTSILANEIAEDKDLLLLYSAHIGRISYSVSENSRAPLLEVVGGIEVDGNTWTISELPSSEMRYPGNELKFQMTSKDSRREWIVLTAFGVTYIAKQRPVDVLVNILQTAGTGGRDDELRRFVDK